MEVDKWQLQRRAATASTSHNQRGQERQSREQSQDEHAEERGDIYRFERTYGAFLREIPLPDHAMVDQAKASFKGGVLEITVPAPPEQVSRGRRLEISQGDQASKSEANKEGAQKEFGR